MHWGLSFFALPLLLAACADGEADTVEVSYNTEEEVVLVLPLESASGGGVEGEGSTWTSACTDAGGSDDVTTVTSLYLTLEAGAGARTSVRWDADPDCSGDPTATSVIALTFTLDGESDGVGWEDGETPEGLNDTVTATRAIYSGDAGDGDFELKVVLFADDSAAPFALYGSNDQPSDVDDDGYPTVLTTEAFYQVTE